MGKFFGFLDYEVGGNLEGFLFFEGWVGGGLRVGGNLRGGGLGWRIVFFDFWGRGRSCEFWV